MAANQEGFDFTAAMWHLCADAAARVPELNHIHMDRVAVTFCQTRSPVLHGLQAKLTPLRFEGGQRQQRRGRRVWTMERVFDQHGREMLYILSFYLPRFLQQSPNEKLITIFHELLHISPDFNGDLRRFPGRCYAHSHSQKDFDAWAERLSQQWFELGAPQSLYGFLLCNFDQLQARYGKVHGLKIRTPRLTAMPAGA